MGLVVAGFSGAGTSSECLADDEGVNIPQASDKTVNASGNHGLKDGVEATDGDGTPKRDYQTEVLSNPNISEIGRVEEITGGGGNTATIVQQGVANDSSVEQEGNDNSASQTQKGKSNDLLVKQNGDHNRSEESQTGDYNHKVKIQSGKKVETTIKQAGESPDAESQQ